MKTALDISTWIGPIQLLPYQPPKPATVSVRKPLLLKRLHHALAPRTRDEAYPSSQHHASGYVESALRLLNPRPEFLDDSTTDALDYAPLSLDYTAEDNEGKPVATVRHPQVGGAVELLEWLEDQMDTGELTLDDALEIMADFTQKPKL